MLGPTDAANRRYSAGAILLHWTIAALVVINIVLGLQAEHDVDHDQGRDCPVQQDGAGGIAPVRRVGGAKHGGMVRL